MTTKQQEVIDRLRETYGRGLTTRQYGKSVVAIYTALSGSVVRLAIKPDGSTRLA